MSNDKKHVIPIQIRYADADMFGHVNNAAFLSYFELGRVMFMQHFLKEIEIRRLRLVVAHIEIDYLTRLYFGDNPECETWVESVGNTSARILSSLRAKGKEVARCSTVIVNLDEHLRPIAFDAEIRDLAIKKEA